MCIFNNKKKIFQEEENLENAKAVQEEKLRGWELAIYPYMIVCGPLDRLTKFFVVVNGINCPCENLFEAVERCYQSLKALGSFPKICSHVWVFLERLVWHVNSKNFNFAHGVNVPVAAIKGETKLTDTNLDE